LNTPNAVTVSAWVKTASANREDIISRYQASAPYNGYALVIAPGFGCGSSGQVGLWFGNGSTYECSSQTVNDGEWHFLAGTYDGTTAKVYIDGAQVASDPQTGNLNETAQNLKIGQESISSGFTADAQIDEARVYNRALGAAEILALYKSGQTRINSSSRNIVSGGLIGWWTFDGANVTDKVYDSSGQGNNGYFYNGATSTAKKAGKVGQAFRFDGTDDYVDVGSSVPFDSSNWTLSLWVDASDVNGSFQRLLSYYNNGPTIWKNSGSGALSIVHGGTADFDMGITLTNNSWTHIVVTRQGSTITAYKDGMQTAQNASFSVTFTNDTSVRMGQATSFDNPYSGSLDDVRIYNRAITAQEVKNLYGMGASKIGGSQANIPGSTLNSGLVGYWSFNGADLTDKIYDTSGQGNNGYFFNGATSTAKTIGKLGQGALFSFANGAYANMGGASSVLNFERTDPFSISAWVKLGVVDDEYPIIGKWEDFGPNYAGWMFGTEDATHWLLFLRNGGTNIMHVSFPRTDSTAWTHVVVTYDGSSAGAGVKGYVNGAPETTTIESDGLTQTTKTAQPITIGGGTQGSIIDGKIDEVRVYNRVLSAAEVRQLYLLGK
jgi:hypothetical protein